jgi:hypothetical protein
MRFYPATLLLLLATSKNVVGQYPPLCEPDCYCIPEEGDDCPLITVDSTTGMPILPFAAAYFNIPGFTEFLNKLFLANPPNETPVLDCQPYPSV